MASSMLAPACSAFASVAVTLPSPEGFLGSRTQLLPVSRRSSSQACSPVACSAQKDEVNSQPLTAGRRQALLGLGAASLGAGLLEAAVVAEPAQAANLNQRLQRSRYYVYVRDKFRAFLDTNPDEILPILNLAFRDAASYDPVTKKGGADGSILFSEELNRPSNAYLKPTVQKLLKVNEEIGAETPNGALGKADLIYVAGEIAMKRAFLNDAIRKAGGNPKKGAELNNAFGSAAQWGLFEKRLGRTDATGPGPDLKLPTKDSSISEIKEAFTRIGFTPRQVVVFASLIGDPDEMIAKYKEDPELAPFCKKYKASREEISQTSYEVDLIVGFTRLAGLGQPEQNTEAYTFYVAPPRVRF